MFHPTTVLHSFTWFHSCSRVYCYNVLADEVICTFSNLQHDLTLQDRMLRRCDCDHLDAYQHVKFPNSGEYYLPPLVVASASGVSIHTLNQNSINRDGGPDILPSI